MMRKSLLSLIPLLATGCLKLPDMETKDGTPATSAQVYEAVKWGWDENKEDNQSIESLNEVSINKSAQLLGQVPRVYERQAFLVVGATPRVVDGQNATEYNILVQTENIADADSENPQSTIQYDYVFAEQQSPASVTAKQITDFLAHQNLSATSEGKPPLAIHYAQFYAFICQPSPASDWKPYCYNLRTWTNMEMAPEGIVDRNGCDKEGLPGCLMKVRYVAFDLVSEVFDKEKGTTSRLKQIIQMKFSSDVPFMARLLSLCYQGIGTFRNQPYVATICNDVVDFWKKWEAPPPPPSSSSKPK